MKKVYKAPPKLLSRQRVPHPVLMSEASLSLFHCSKTFATWSSECLKPCPLSWSQILFRDHRSDTVHNKLSDIHEQFSWVPLPYCSPPGCPFPIKSLALSAHVSPWTIHFRVLDKSPVSGPGRGPSSCNKWRLWWDSSSLRLTSWPLRVLRGQLACQWTRARGRNWDRFVPGLLTRTTGQSTLTGKEQETLLTSLPFPLSFLSLTLPILPRFSSPPVLDAGIWSKGLSGRRASAWAEDWRLITSSWQRTQILVLVWSDFW